eukprot:COSAG01_NODE_4560_length_4920_cov_21.560672_3_plen_74_part_00
MGRLLTTDEVIRASGVTPLLSQRVRRRDLPPALRSMQEGQPQSVAEWLQAWTTEEEEPRKKMPEPAPPPGDTA